MFAWKTLNERALRIACMTALLLAAPLAARAQTTTVCGAEVKTEIAKQLDAASKLSEAEQMKVQAGIYEKYKNCGTVDASHVSTADPFFVAARQCGARVAFYGSMFYEEMPCCGYDPQRRTFACPVKIKRNFGFGPSPLPGSREYVLHCVADPAGVWQPVGEDSVHLSDSALNPSWQFGVVANATDHLSLVQPMNGQARRARSILSWNLRPTGCGYQPIWGNVVDYTIRLDQ
jgi:hypothetical protein